MRIARGSVIYYSDLVVEISSIDLEPQSPQLAHMLGEISTEEHEADMPGPRFFALAGHDMRDRGCGKHGCEAEV